MTQGQRRAALRSLSGESLLQTLRGDDAPIPCFRNALSQGTERLFALYDEGVPVGDLVSARCQVVDTLVREAWSLHMPADAGAALVAVGGYGRQELHPASDVDILILVSEIEQGALRSALEGLIVFLWDIGLEVGSSVRTVDECVSEAREDVTVVTNLIESRLLARISEM